jgi:hypothetical protein
LEIVATGAQPFPDLMDTFKAIPAGGGGVLLIVLAPEIAEVMLDYGVKHVDAAGNVLITCMYTDENDFLLQMEGED